MSGSVWDTPAPAAATAAAAVEQVAPAPAAKPALPQTWEVSVKAPDGKWFTATFFGEHEADMYALTTIKQVRAAYKVPAALFTEVRIVAPA